MSGVTIYMEGGGDSTEGKSRLGAGMSGFLRELKEEVRKNRCKWQLVPCGDRQQAYDAFSNARDHVEEGEIVILLVNAESSVTVPTPVEHLRTRPGDGWDLNGVDEDDVHLMVQVMETWIVSDSNALAAYYGQGFRANALPSRSNLEEEDKTAVASALARRLNERKRATTTRSATPPTSSHSSTRQGAGALPHCERLFATLGAAVAVG